MPSLPKTNRKKLYKFTYESRKGRLPEHRFDTYQYTILKNILEEYGKAYIQILKNKSIFIYSPSEFPVKPRQMLTIIGMKES